MTTRRELLKRAGAAPAAAWWMTRPAWADDPKLAGTIYFRGGIQTGPANRAYQQGLVTLDLKGGTWSVLELGNSHYPRLSPDGKWVTYTTSLRDPRRLTIWLADAASGEARELVAGDDKNWTSGARWMPDGRSLIYTQIEDFAAEPHRWSTWVIGREGGEPRRLEAIPDTDLLLAIAPDGRRFVTTTRTKNPGEVAIPPMRHELFVVEADGLGRRPLIGDVSPFEVRFSPDGRRLAITNIHWKLDPQTKRPATDEGSLIVVGIDGKDAREVYRREGGGGFAWSPDGQHLAVAWAIIVRDETGRIIPGTARFRLGIIPAEGGEPTEVPVPNLLLMDSLDWR